MITCPAGVHIAIIHLIEIEIEIEQ